MLLLFKNNFSCRLYFKIIDIIVWFCCNLLCGSLIYLFSCLVNVRMLRLERNKNYSGKMFFIVCEEWNLIKFFLF